ncbi:MAG TPA: CoA transferase [Dehalococcoidia bacterium]|nr:CoA transferase [Dehalococcoidia bacterium]
MRALDDVRVLDLSTSIAGDYCTKLLADLGADVIKVEPPGGDPVRQLGPFRGGKADAETGGLHLYLNANKRSIVADLEKDAGRERVRELSRDADMLVETLAPGRLPALGLGYEALARANPRLIVASLTPFGQSGPWKDWLSDEIVEFALGGYMYFAGDARKPPLLVPGFQGGFQLGTQAAVHLLAALFHQRETGAGQQIDASGMEAFLSAHSWLTTAWSHAGTVLRRTASDLTRCKDGWVFYFQGPFSTNILLLLERPDLLEDPRFADHASWIANGAVIKELWEAWCTDRTKAEIYHAAQELRIPVAPVNTVADLFVSPQLAARDWFVEVEQPRAGRVRQPGFPYKLSATPPAIARPAPLLGEHEAAAGKAQWAGGDASEPRRPAADPAAGGSARRLALDGVRVLELTANWAGPLAGRLLADLGAEVIKIELASKPATRALFYPGNDPMKYHYNRAAYFNLLNRNKYGISLNLAKPAGKEVFWQLLRRADLVIENNSARVMHNLGLDYKHLRAVNPRVTLVSMSGYGGSGPERDYVAYGSTIEATSGLAALTGYGPDEPFRTGSYYADPITGAHGAIAALAALHARRQRGEGQFVDMALNEVAAAFFGEALMDYALNGTVREPRGNRSPRCAPQGAYACTGADAWVALAVRDDGEFEKLCRAIGREELAGEARFATQAARQAQHDALDEILSAWAKTVDHNEAARLLQAAGVPAAPVLANWEALSNPHLFARGFYVPIVHPEAGVFPFPGAPCKLSETPVTVRLPAPRFAEHNEYVYRELLGLPAASVVELREQGVIDDTPVTPMLGKL